MMRIGLLVLAQLAVLLSVTLAANWIGIGQWIGGDGIELSSVFLYCALFVFFGAVLPALFSKWATRRAVLSRIITQPDNATEAWLLHVVERQARLEGIKTPEVGVYESPTMRAYAAGLDKDAALIAVSSGLLENMDRREAEAMLGKKVKHVARGDMLIPIFFSLLVCWVIARSAYGF